MRTAFFIQRDPRRLSTALLFSLIVHALLLSITLGGQTFGLPALNFPWKEKRLGANELRILLAPAQPTIPANIPEPVFMPAQKPAAASEVTPMTMPPSAFERREPSAVLIPPPPPPPMPTPAPAPPVEPAVSARKRPDVDLPIASNAPPVLAPAIAEARTTRAQVSEAPVPHKAAEAAQKQIDQAAQEKVEQARLEREKQTAERLRQAELTATAQREAARQEQLRQDAARAEQTARNETARIEAERQETLRRDTLQKERAKQDENAQQETARQELERAEAAKVEAARLEAVRKEAARQEQLRLAQLEAARQAQNKLDAARDEAARQEAARRDAAKQEAARQEQVRQDALKQEAARQNALKQEAARQEQARQDAIKQEAARQNAAKQELARQEQAKQDAARQESARQDAAKQEAARQEQAKQDLAQREKAEQEAKREERLRAIGKQLNEEAAQRDAANKPSRSLLPGFSSLRRGWLLGRADPNADLVAYAEAMSRKIEMNMTLDIIRAVVKQPHTQPTVTVAVRADGSVEKVTFVVSSGVPAIDETIRQVIASQAPFGAFPPTVARQYDVVEIRRTWIFDTAIRLQ